MKFFSGQFLKETVEIAQLLDYGPIERAANILADLKVVGGRLFILGVGGSAANASHAVNDFRKICGIEAYAPTDNVSELTARTNDEGWDTVFEAWLRGSNLSRKDVVLVLSVGGGNEEKNISPNLVKALRYADSVMADIIGIVGRDGGYTANVADACIIIPTVNDERVTPHTEAWQAIVWHLLVSHPLLKSNQTKWESTKKEPILFRAVFLDRDGTLITGSGRSIKVQIDAIASIKRLKDSGFQVIMVTNQPDIARENISRASVDATNGALKYSLGLDAVYVCPHDDRNECKCRKPKPGMLRQAAEDLGVVLKYSYIVGDTWRDMHAGQSAGCKTVQLNTSPGLPPFWEPTRTVKSLTEAVDFILEDSK